MLAASRFARTVERHPVVSARRRQDPVSAGAFRWCRGAWRSTGSEAREVLGSRVLHSVGTPAVLSSGPVGRAQDRADPSVEESGTARYGVCFVRFSGHKHAAHKRVVARGNLDFGVSVPHMSRTGRCHGTGQLGLGLSSAVKLQVGVRELASAHSLVGRCCFGMYKKGPDRRFRWSGPKFPVPPAGFEPAHTAPE